MEVTDNFVWRHKTRRAMTRLFVEAMIGGSDSTPAPAEMRLVYLVVLDATLHGVEIPAARISAITSVPRTTIGRRLAWLRKQKFVEVGPKGGWRVPEDHLNRPDRDVWLDRLRRMVVRSAKVIMSDSDT